MAPHPNNQNQLPFKWPETPQMLEEYNDDNFEQTEKATVDGVVNTIKNIVNTFVTESTTTLEETFNSNNTAVENDQNSFVRMSDSNSTMTQVNNTIVNEILNSNSISMGGEMTESTATTVISMENSTNSTSFIDTVTTTTQTVFNTVSEIVTPPKTVTTEETITVTAMHHDEYVEDKTLYIVLGVVLAALILIVIILLIIYRRYKMIRSPTTRVYCVQKTHDVKM